MLRRARLADAHLRLIPEGERPRPDSVVRLTLPGGREADVFAYQVEELGPAEDVED